MKLPLSIRKYLIYAQSSGYTDHTCYVQVQLDNQKTLGRFQVNRVKTTPTFNSK